jgi:uncharacterized protein (TIGR02147 family)
VGRAVRPSIFGFLDYRAYLRALIAAEKGAGKAFSYRYIARKAGVRSPSFLKLVADGQRNLGPDTIERFGQAFGLSAEEQDFFAHLVAFNQATSAAEANRHFESINASRRFRAARLIDSGMFEYLSCWYYPAIREMAARPDFTEDPEWIAHELLPQITAGQARVALKLLFDLGLLVRGVDGRVTRGEPALDTGHQVASRAVVNYHRQMLDRASEALESVPGTRRDIIALTLAIRPGTVADLKQRMHAFRETVVARCDDDREPEVIYQMNIQLFPLTQDPDRAKAARPRSTKKDGT